MRVERKKHEEQKREIETVRKRREACKQEKIKMEAELVMIGKDKFRLENAIQNQKEEEYHIRNARLLTEIRLKEQRPEPFDLIIKNLSFADQFGMGEKLRVLQKVLSSAHKYNEY